MGVTTTNNKPFNPRGNDQSPKGFNRAKLFSGKALDFDGVNDYVQCDNLDTLYSSDFTISYFFKWESTGDNWGVTQGQNGTNQSIITGKQNSGVIRFAFWGNDLDAPVSLTPAQNEWAFLSFTYNRTTKERKIYINGILAAEDVSAANPNPTASTFQISAFTTIGGYYNNQVSNVKVFNTALTAAQVADLYNNPEKVVPTGVDNTALKLWLPMMEGAGTTAYDGSGNGNHGTISGATYVNGIGAPSPQSAVIDWNKGVNKFAQSNDFSQSAWNLKNGTFAQGVSDPLGGLKAWSWTATDTDPYIYQQFSVSGTHTMSIYAKGVGSTIGKDFEIRVATTIQSFTLTSEWQRFELDGSPSNTNLGFEYGNPAVGGDVVHIFGAQVNEGSTAGPYIPTIATAQTTPVLLPQGLTTGRDITGVNLFENVRKQGALNLDGNSWAEVHDNESLDITDAITLEAWVYFDSNNSNKGLLGKWYTSSNNRAWLIYQVNATQFRFIVSDNGTNTNAISSNALSEGWNHFVGVDDGTNIKVYSNGSLDSTGASFGSLYEVNKALEIGLWNSETIKQFPNQIAQPRIYNRALTASEIQQNYNAGKNTYTNS